jgi:sulfur carrier protein
VCIEELGKGQRNTVKAGITLRLEPENYEMTMDRPKTVLQLLNRLGSKPTVCLVIREPREPGQKRLLLTPDLTIAPNDVITVRKVTSSG